MILLLKKKEITELLVGIFFTFGVLILINK